MPKYYLECFHCKRDAFGLHNKPKAGDLVSTVGLVHKDNPEVGREIKCQRCGYRLFSIDLLTGRVKLYSELPQRGDEVIPTNSPLPI